MIALLSGILSSKSPQEVIVDVHGVGYQIAIALSTYFNLSHIGSPIQLWISTHIRNDTIQLFGFGTNEEKQAFLLLTGVTGIGPKLALSALSSFSVPDLCTAIEGNDTDKLASIPGVGKKSASRIILELKGKTNRIFLDTAGGTSPIAHPASSVFQEEAASALLNLGYRAPEVKEALSRALSKIGETYELEGLIRTALKELAKQ
jgi:holliday junction DNA helicase RuvA